MLPVKRSLLLSPEPYVVIVLPIPLPIALDLRLIQLGTGLLAPG
ncbi:hypothetical protein [Serratia marcescens]|nr:hypothetical protein [Serratia marcescens]